MLKRGPDEPLGARYVNGGLVTHNKLSSSLGSQLIFRPPSQTVTFALRGLAGGGGSI